LARSPTYSIAHQPLSTLLVTFLWAILWPIFTNQAVASDSSRIASQNMNRLFDDIDNGQYYETVLSTKKFHTKATLAAQKFVTDFQIA